MQISSIWSELRAGVQPKPSNWQSWHRCVIMCAVARLSEAPRFLRRAFGGCSSWHLTNSGLHVQSFVAHSIGVLVLLSCVSSRLVLPKSTGALPAVICPSSVHGISPLPFIFVPPWYAAGNISSNHVSSLSVTFLLLALCVSGAFAHYANWSHSSSGGSLWSGGICHMFHTLTQYQSHIISISHYSYQYSMDSI